MSGAKKPQGPKIPQEVSRAFAEHTARKSTHDFIWEIDYSINSSLPRLFIYDLKRQKLWKYKCAHGVGGKNAKPHDGRCREVSNKSGSYMSNLGVAVTTQKYSSESVGLGLRIMGLSPTNSNMLSRGIVFHGSLYVHDTAGNTDKSISGRSYGCPAVDDSWHEEIIDMLEGGAIGVMHYACRFSL